MTVAMTMAPPPSAVAGQDLGNPTLATFTFTDGSIDDYTAVIDWGDGTVSDGTITPDVSGGWDVSGDYTYSAPAPMNVEVTVQGDGYGASGMVPLNVAPGSGSGSGSGSGGSSSGGGSNSGGGSGSTGGTMPDGLSQDLALIGQNSNLTVNPELLPFSYLMIRGGTSWDDLKPGQPSTQSSSNSNTQTVNGTTYTTTSSSSSTYTTDGNPGSSGGGSWSISYQEQDSFSQTITGTDSSGRATTSIANNTADLTWDAWGDNGGVTHYKVVSDDTEDDSYSADERAYAQEADQANDAHLKAEGVVGTDGTLQSGDFTYAGDISNTFSLTDGFHPPSGHGAGDSVSYEDSTAENLSEGGNLIPGSSSQGGMTLNSSETGDISITDGQGGFDGVSRNDADSVQESYDGSQPTATPPPGGGTKGTISTGGPKKPIPIPNGKNTIDVIDIGDRGWFAWTPT